MGWFDEQIHSRRQRDEAMLEDACSAVAQAVRGSRSWNPGTSQAQKTGSALGQILRYFRLKPRPVPEEIEDIQGQLEYLLRPQGIMHRKVMLTEHWQREAFGPMLGFLKKDHTAVALLPRSLGGYGYVDPETGEKKKIGRKNLPLFRQEALCFYKPFPLRKLGLSELVHYIFTLLSPGDYLVWAGSALAVVLTGMLMPRLSRMLAGEVIQSGQVRVLGAIVAFVACAGIAGLLLEAVKALVGAKIHTKLDTSVQAAAMARILSLPPAFFKNYSAGELSSRTAQVNSLCSMLVGAIMNGGFTALFSLCYVGQIFAYAPGLTWPALGILGASMAASVISALIGAGVSRKRMKLSAQKSGMAYGVLSGIEKIKVSGAEKRAFARWSRLYAQEVRLIYHPPGLLKYHGTVNLAITLCGTALIYYLSVRNGVSPQDYFAFHCAYGMVSAAFLTLTSAALTAANIRPVMEMVEPVLGTAPEVTENKQPVDRISGGIELNNVTFRYGESMPKVLDNLTLKIRPGQYVAIVGKTGCGKSTLLRLLLGFETPEKGAIYYDGRDMAGLDLGMLRRKIGVVMQNGRLFQGDIYSNIVISAPWLTVEDAWEAAAMAGIDEDIRNLPMGMHTVVGEGTGGISGGQRQRLMIARAIAPRPRILMFDEATSALDNLTQKHVSRSLDSLHCTRLVIAHRLSTIKACDRILVLDGGKIIEDGNYRELMEKKGFFADLVSRQRMGEAQNS